MHVKSLSSPARARVFESSTTRERTLITKRDPSAFRLTRITEPWAPLPKLLTFSNFSCTTTKRKRNGGFGVGKRHVTRCVFAMGACRVRAWCSKGRVSKKRYARGVRDVLHAHTHTQIKTHTTRRSSTHHGDTARSLLCEPLTEEGEAVSS